MKALTSEFTLSPLCALYPTSNTGARLAFSAYYSSGGGERVHVLSSSFPGDNRWLDF